MTAPHIVDPAGLLGEALSEASPDLMRHLLGTVINALLSAEADAVCGAEWGRPSPDRVNQRNGYRHRDLDTRVGTIDVAVPKLRSGTYFPEWLLERRKRAEAALISVVATCYLLGVSTRRMDKLVQSLGITSLSKSQVSRMAVDLDGQVEAFRTRPLGPAGPFTFVAADALTMKVREDGRVVGAVVLVATGVNADGHREVLGCKVATSETKDAWNTFFADLVARGLTGVRLVTSDAHAGLVEAIAANLPAATWQRCRTHYAANLMSTCPKSSWPAVKAMLHSVYDQPDPDAVQAQFDKMLDQLTAPLPEVADHLDRARADLLAFTCFPKEIWRQIWSNNLRRTPEQGDPPPHRRGGHLPRPARRDPPGRRRPGRTTRRMGRRTPLLRPGRPGPRPHPPTHGAHHRHPRAAGRRMNPNEPAPADQSAASAPPGAETGWWNQDGTPAPWPDDFPNNWRPDTHHVTPEPGQPPF
jgi:putative transposase